MHYTACWEAKTGDSAAYLKKIQLSIFVENTYKMQSMGGGGGTSIINIVPLVAKVKPPRLTEYEAGPLTKQLRTHCPVIRKCISHSYEEIIKGEPQ